MYETHLEKVVYKILHLHNISLFYIKKRKRKRKKILKKERLREREK